MGLRHLYHLLVHSERKTKQSPQYEAAKASSSDPRSSAIHSSVLVVDTIQAETTPLQAAQESPLNQEGLPSDVSRGKQPQLSNTLPLDVRTNQPRYSQIFHNRDVEAIGMPSPDESTPTTQSTESTKALFPPLPPFRMRKRSCGGA